MKLALHDIKSKQVATQNNVWLHLWLIMCKILPLSIFCKLITIFFKMLLSFSLFSLLTAKRTRKFFPLVRFWSANALKNMMIGKRKAKKHFLFWEGPNEGYIKRKYGIL